MPHYFFENYPFQNFESYLVVWFYYLAFLSIKSVKTRFTFVLQCTNLYLDCSSLDVKMHHPTQQKPNVVPSLGHHWEAVKF